jgi:hypothetical protein
MSANSIASLQQHSISISIIKINNLKEIKKVKEEPVGIRNSSRSYEGRRSLENIVGS